MVRAFFGLVLGLGVLWTGTCLGQEGAAAVAETAEVAATPAPEVTEVVATAALNQGDQAWLLTSCALVLLMSPGLAFFYGGLVGRKNVLSILMQCFMCMCLITILWTVCGYSIAFSGEEVGEGFCGNPLTHFMLAGVSESAPLQPAKEATLGISQQTFMVFQMMFAIITPGLIIGAFAERMKFVAFLVFTALWSLIVYSPIAHWVWYGPAHPIFGLGAFDDTATPIGALDFAGGTVVHINAGVAALVACLVIGPRRGYPAQITPPHNLPFAVLGAGLLWFGWFGFNGGSALGASDQAVRAFVTTQIAAAAAGFTWSVIELIRNGRATALGMITGCVAGLVAITPAAGFVTPGSALIIGAGGTIISYIFVAYVKPAMKYDDSLDVFGVHGMAGVWGAIATGIFAMKGYGVDKAGGLIHGNSAQVTEQVIAVAVTIVYSGVVSFILLKLIDFTIGLRCTEDSEKMGLDLSDHAETAYTVS
ncbi:Ammonium transporter NrgA [Pirellula sp. SH-Sr6A]|uniref:ammonium transporter n=1 Tax=Pirellula sp. SH-Sr6A TaxID=1632865 RepID=UPI00078BAEB4|nr:ammonium transporter [Pirellula sp. SH-Sr6A]AMV31804.1 Ammonium transporter NrgA [Pirellula sp. SH-Sr6A]